MEEDFSRFFPKAGEGAEDFSRFFPEPAKPSPSATAAALPRGQRPPSAEDIAMADPTRGMSGLEKAWAAFGGALPRLGAGISQLLPTAVGDATPGAIKPAGRVVKDAAAEQAQIDEAKRTDLPLLRTGAGLAGSIVGGVATGLPLMAIPGAGTYAGAAMIGGLQGAIQPVATGDSRLANAAIGTGAGVLGQGVGNTIGRVLRPVQPAANAERDALVQAAQANQIPLTIGQQTGSRPMQVMESVFENLPFTSGPQLAAKRAQAEAYNTAVGRTFGSEANAITPEVMGEARRRIGGQFGELAGRNTLQADDQLIGRLAQIETNAQRNLTPDVGRVVMNRVDDVLARIENGQMSGTAYRNLDSELGRAARGSANGDLRNALGDLRGALREGMDSSISEADRGAWQQARRQYANLMTVAPVAARNEMGDVSGRTLLSAANAGNRNARFGAPSELADLGRVGRAFVAEQIPNSGTAQRQFVQGLLTTGGLSGLGAGGAAMTGHDPMTGALLGAGATGAGLIAPRVVQSILGTEAARRYLTNGIVALTQAERRSLSAATGALSTGSGLALAGQ